MLWLNRNYRSRTFTTAALLFITYHKSAVCFSVPFRTLLLSPSRRAVNYRCLSQICRAGGSSTMSPSFEGTTNMDSSPPQDEKLNALRISLDNHKIQVYIVPSDDPHLSEYTPNAYMRRAFISNFHGSAGTAVVTNSSALLWTDTRYFNEANLALDHNHWTLMKQGTPNVPTVVSWLAKEANKYYQEHKSPFRIGIDPFVHPASFANDLTKALEAENKDHTIAELVTSIPENLIDSIWSHERPPIPSSPFRIHPIEFAGQSHYEKVKLVQSQLNEHKATLAIFSTLDDVAYLLNLRAMGDVATCPVGLAYVTVANDRVTLYCDARKIGSEDVKLHLSNVIIRPYDAIVTDLLAHVQESESNKVWMDTSRANLALASVVPKKQLLDQATIISQTKACKNEAEMEGMRRAHRVDGAAMAEFMAWLEKTLEERSVSEVEIDIVLTSCRAKQPGFLEVSFPTIAGVGSNGAIIHYRAKADSELLKYLDKTQPILIDSGGQYLYGTTDVTRTWHFGTPSAEFKNYYTRVLKGNIGVDTMIFPELTPGFVLDVMARKSLWEYGKDYGHGTGHGVGAALNVHEGPHSISPRWGNTEGLKNGMVVSNEPGYYEDGNFGIRIENLLEIAFVNPLHSGTIETNKEKKFLKFQKLTLIPIQKNLIDTELMTKEELDWLDAYHQQILEQVGPLLDEGSAAWKWLIKSCSPIDR